MIDMQFLGAELSGRKEKIDVRYGHWSHCYYRFWRAKTIETQPVSTSPAALDAPRRAIRC